MTSVKNRISTIKNFRREKPLSSVESVRQLWFQHEFQKTTEITNRTREIENTFKKINEGLESFNYHYERHEDLNNQIPDRNLESQKEKLEADLKREIKKLQKNRELIKNWQLNDGVEVVVTRNKLQEYRRLVEEAMEKYKEVEKSSKMKSFSNQSIMLASLEESQHLTKEAIEVINFLQESAEELNNQIENLEAEYEKISSRKTKKNSLIESEKQDIENFLSKDRFHLESFEKIIDYIKQKQIDPELVVKIQDDINFYLESNQEPDFIDDETLYDEIFQQAESNYTYVPKESDTSLVETIEKSENESNGHVTSSAVPVKKTQKSKSPTPNTPTKKANEAITPVKNRVSTPDIEIVQKLKPAATPSKVTGEVAWSSVAGVHAAVGVAPSSLESDKATLVNGLNLYRRLNDSSALLQSGAGEGTLYHENSNDSVSEIKNIKVTPVSSESPYYNYYKVLEGSGLADVELKVFSDSNLAKVPPGIQSLILSFNSTRSIRIDGNSSDLNNAGKILFNSPRSNPLSSTLKKPYLPATVQCSAYQNSVNKPSFIKPPLHLTNYQSYWNKIRGNESYDILVNEIKSLVEQQQQALIANPSGQPSLAVINELMMVFFFGFYYGLTPLENMIAESKLFDLGWKPYAIKTNQLNQKDNKIQADKYFYWVRNLKSPEEVQEVADFGDYQVFDLASWDIHLKLGFRMDSTLAESNVMSVVA